MHGGSSRKHSLKTAMLAVATVAALVACISVSNSLTMCVSSVDVTPPIKFNSTPSTSSNETTNDLRWDSVLSQWRKNPLSAVPFAKPVLVLYPSTASWERDAMFAEIFPPFLYPLLHVVEHEHKLKDILSGAADFLAQIPPERRVAVVQPPIMECEDIKFLSLVLRPAVLFIFSDEHGGRECHHDAGRFGAPLSFRQYSGQASGYPMDGRSMFQLPLAWLPGTFDPKTYDRAKLTPASKRELLWSFVGDLKADRREMVNVLSALEPHNALTNLSTGRREMIENFYKRSVFVPVGRGYVRLDCSRIYEGSKAGAIPVMVVPRSEVADAFGHFFDVVEAPEARVEHFPPWVVADSWGSALAEMRTLLADPAELDRRQRAVLDFYEAIVLNARFAIYRQLATPPTLNKMLNGSSGMRETVPTTPPPTTSAPVERNESDSNNKKMSSKMVPPVAPKGAPEDF